MSGTFYIKMISIFFMRDLPLLIGVSIHIWKSFDSSLKPISPVTAVNKQSKQYI